MDRASRSLLIIFGMGKQNASKPPSSSSIEGRAVEADAALRFGRFKDAIETARRASNLAQAAGQSGVAEKNRKLLEVYQSARPYRPPQPARGTSGRNQ